MQKNKKFIPRDFDEIHLKVASPDKILEWSYGEVTKPETMNYRTQRSEKNGLFDEKIFGPERDFECYCGKYRGIRYKNIVCEKCGVEVTRAIVRRERMGHIELATPVSHIWFLRAMPSRIGLILGMTTSDLEKVVYFAGYLVTEVHEDERKQFLKELDSEYKTKLKSSQDQKTKDALKNLFTQTKKDIEYIKEGVVLDEVEYHKYSMKYSTLFEAEIGAEAVHKIFKNLDLEKLLVKLLEQKETATGLVKDKLTKRISLISSMAKSGVRPEWMFLTRIPVIPPGLRPMVALDGGRHATSDVNDLYRRVINRNNRLKKLLEISAPDVILRNEKRILQEAVDALIDNSIRHGNQLYAGASQAQKRPLKSISDNLKGKRGLFRSNLLGKRVDYSGRSVIVVGPSLKLHQCGLPKHMALELFKPFVISGLLKRELAFNIRGAGKLIEESIPEVWEVLEEVIQNKYVLLNRAPTLHRLGIQAFQPILIEGEAIQVHPLVCTAFNADFDGDQMAVHVPLSQQAQYEAREIMAADKNILKPGSGDLILSANKLDIILGCYWMTKRVDGEKGEGKLFPSPNNAITAFDYDIVSLRAKILVGGKENSKYADYVHKPLETSVGRILFNSVLPDDYPFINEPIDSKKMAVIINDLINKYGIENVTPTLDKVKEFGFKYATYSGTTWGHGDIVIPDKKYDVINEAEQKVKEIVNQYNEGFLSDEEKLRKVVEIWHGVKNQIEQMIPETLDPNGSVYDLWKSGARGSISQITQMAGMKGLIQNAHGETIEHPVLSSSKEGLTPIEYFTTTHGSRKGLTDTALNTARAGYLTRKLFSVAQDVIVSEENCGTTKSIVITGGSDSGIQVPLSRKIFGRVLAQDVQTENGEKIFAKEHLLSKEDAQKIEESGVKEVAVFSPLTCASHNGVCARCYGYDLGNGKQVDIGEAVGTVAAQAIGEPGTQLTMRTFHAGGTASVGGDITQGLPRVEEIFERRKPKSPAAIARVDGLISEILEEGKEKVIILAPKDPKNKKTKKDTEYRFSFVRTPLVKVGDEVEKGQFLTDGSADLQELFALAGREKTQEYIIGQVNKIYELQGESVSRKHIEIIIRQMFSRLKITSPGDTNFSEGEVVEEFELERVNAELPAAKEKAKAKALIMGIAEVALSKNSFLSAASFQHTTRVLISGAVRGAADRLRGLKENVIIGRLIPAGSGFKGSQKWQNVREIEEEIEREVLENSMQAE
ncbi:DNA-directed RNA polymerase subunit beta' [Candidatus Nomurabacteria bacterium]|nr:DNA-directed RNA polymerase subunit beta' [Candidatus Nomurabacteria bacterium]